MGGPKSKLLIGFVALIWLTVMVCLYYVSHKPLTPAFALSLVGVIWRLGVAFLLAALAGGIGLRVLEGFGLPHLPDEALDIAVQTASGFGLLSLGVLVFGSLIGINSIWAWLSLIALMVLFHRSILSWLKKWKGWPEFLEQRAFLASWLWLDLGRYFY